MSKLNCANCGEVFVYMLDCPTEILHYEDNSEGFCCEDCMHQYFDMEECAYCEETHVCEHYDERETYEGRTCSQDCHEEAMYLWGQNHGDPNYEHRTY